MIARLGIGYCPEDRGIFSALTVRENLFLLPKISTASQTNTPGMSIEEIFELFPNLKERLESMGTRLSGGEQQMLAMARILLTGAKFLLLDEITAALPSDLSERVFGVVRAWRARGKSVIFISHRMAEVETLCDRATVLRDGATVGVTPARGARDIIVQMMLGAEVAKAASAPVSRRIVSPNAAIPALEVRQLASGRLLRDISFSLAPGEVLGITALEGQGQLELFECIAGVRRPDSGSILAQGRELRLRHPADAIRAGLVLVPAKRLQALLPQRSIHENVALAAFGQPGAWGPIAVLAEAQRVGKAVARLQIDTRAAAQVSRLSGGNQQKVVIARWLAAGFNTLVCFDPTSGIDIGTKQQIYSLLREIAGQGASVLLFTSELPEIRLACDRAITLYGGRISGSMTAADADEGRLLRAAHGLPGVETEARARRFHPISYAMAVPPECRFC